MDIQYILIFLFNLNIGMSSSSPDQIQKEMTQTMDQNTNLLREESHTRSSHQRHASWANTKETSDGDVLKLESPNPRNGSDNTFEGHMRSLSGHMLELNLSPDNSIAYSPDPEVEDSIEPLTLGDPQDEKHGITIQSFPIQQAQHSGEGVGRKHRRVYSGGVSNPVNAHRRVDSRGGAEFVRKHEAYSRGQGEYPQQYSTYGHRYPSDAEQSANVGYTSPPWHYPKRPSRKYELEPSYDYAPRAPRHPPPPGYTPPPPPPHQYSPQYSHPPARHRRVPPPHGPVYGPPRHYPAPYSYHPASAAHPNSPAYHSPYPPHPRAEEIHRSRHVHSHHPSHHPSSRHTSPHPSSRHTSPHPSSRQTSPHPPSRHSSPYPPSSHDHSPSYEPDNAYSASSPGQNTHATLHSERTYKQENLSRQHPMYTKRRQSPPNHDAYEDRRETDQHQAPPFHPLTQSQPIAIQKSYARQTSGGSIGSTGIIETEEKLTFGSFSDSRMPRNSPQLFESVLTGEPPSKPNRSPPASTSPYTETVPSPIPSNAQDVTLPPENRARTASSDSRVRNFVQNVKASNHERGASIDSLVINDDLFGENILQGDGGPMSFDVEPISVAPDHVSSLNIGQGTTSSQEYDQYQNYHGEQTQAPAPAPAPVYNAPPVINTEFAVEPATTCIPIAPSAQSAPSSTQPEERKIQGTVSKRTRRKCKVDGCENRVVQGGVCISHGAKRKTCGHPGCTKHVKKAGMCSAHGPPRKLCESEGCTKVAVQGGRCIKHGAKKKMCSIDGCQKQAILSGMCKKHHDEAEAVGTNQQSPSHSRGLSIFHDQDFQEKLLNTELNMK